jgi:hypothetical protein
MLSLCALFSVVSLFRLGVEHEISISSVE